MLLFDRHGYNAEYNCYLSRYYAKLALKRLRYDNGIIIKGYICDERVYKILHLVEVEGG